MPHSLIAIVDDDEAVRRSTLNLLNRAGRDAKAFESGDDFLADPPASRFSCILLDVRMPGRDGLAVLRELVSRGDTPPILMVTGRGDIAVAVEAMRLGAHDFMEKPYEPAHLFAAIEKALTCRLRTKDAQTFRSEATALVGTLSRRQRQVLQGILQGLQNKLIAYELGLSIRTVEAYRAQLLAKLGVRGTAEAVRLALAAGLRATASLVVKVLLLFSSAGGEIFGTQPLNADLEQMIVLTMA